MKICLKCKSEQPKEYYSKCSRNKDGLNFYCKSCIKLSREDDSEKIKIRFQKYYHENKDIIQKNNKEYSNNNRDVLRVKKQEYRAANPEKMMYTAAKSRAKSRNIEFSIELSDIVIPDVCPVLNIPLIVAKGVLSPNSPSLHRINTKIGYIKGNVQVISHKANMMKSDASNEQLLLFANWVVMNCKN